MRYHSSCKVDLRANVRVIPHCLFDNGSYGRRLEVGRGFGIGFYAVMDAEGRIGEGDEYLLRRGMIFWFRN